MILAIIALAYAGDTFTICNGSGEFTDQCYVQVDKCLKDAYAEGAEPDLAFNWCADEWGQTLNNLKK
jgi:hypothetical protein